MVGQGLGSYDAETASKKTGQFLSIGGYTYSGVYTPFRFDRDRLIGHIFGSIARRKHRTAKITAPYYRQLFTVNPMALTPFSVAAVRNDQD